MVPGTPSNELELGALRRASRSAALAMLLAALVLLPLLGHNRLTDWDEGIYAGISRAMLSDSPLAPHLLVARLLVPHWNAQPWFEKPPLMLWITALFFRLFGVSEFWARAGSALSGVALIGLLHGWLTFRAPGDPSQRRLTAWLSSVVLLATFGFQHVARVGEMDVLLSLGVCMALIGLTELQRSTSSSSVAPSPRAAWLFFWLGFAIAVMTKGAAGITLPVTLAVMLALEPELRRRMDRSFLLGCALFLVAVLPWHLFMLHRFGRVFLTQYLGLHVLQRATMQIEGHVTPWWFYLRVLLVSAAPFVLLYPFALWEAFRQPRFRLFRAFAVFSLVELLFFTFIQTRLPHYIAPVYPTLSVLTAAWLANRIAHRVGAAARPQVFNLQLAAIAVPLYLAAALLTRVPRKALHSPRLPNGVVTPDNRQQVALLKQVFTHPQPSVAATCGPLLAWLPGVYNPIPSAVFYADRPVQQIQLQPVAPNQLTDKYVFNPIPLDEAVTTETRVLLIDRTLLPSLPHGFIFQPLATSSTLEIGSLARHP